jgi:hypothetical protein
MAGLRCRHPTWHALQKVFDAEVEISWRVAETPCHSPKMRLHVVALQFPEGSTSSHSTPG